MANQESTVRAVRDAACEVDPSWDTFDALMDLVGDSRFVLLGEATHGSHEFYAARAAITRRLIAEKGFAAVAVEADWPDAYRVNQFVRGLGEDDEPEEALSGFDRFPTWMWRNTDVAEFTGWLRTFNASLRRHERVGFYGLDMYSLRRSMREVVDYLERVDPPAAQRARARYACFDQFGSDPQMYGYAAGLGISRDCEDEVVAQLVEVLQSRSSYLGGDGLLAEDEQFSAEMNARLARNAEEYYRRLYHGTNSSWNLRDRHMFDMFQALSDHLGRNWARPKIVIWAHNSHLGDARATSMADRGEVNLGQLVRQVHRENSLLVGFTTCEGVVAAASEWGGAVERKRIRPAADGSYEALMHATQVPNFVLPMRESDDAVELLAAPRLERAIGVIYRPQSELASHYFRASLPAQFDAVVHFDVTTPITPLEVVPNRVRAELAETFPSGL